MMQITISCNRHAIQSSRLQSVLSNGCFISLVVTYYMLQKYIIRTCVAAISFNSHRDVRTPSPGDHPEETAFD